MSRFAHVAKLEFIKVGIKVIIRVNLLHPFTVLIPLWFIIISLVFFYLSKLLIPGFL